MLRRRGLPRAGVRPARLWWRRRSRLLERRNGLPLRRRGSPPRGRAICRRGRRGRGAVSGAPLSSAAAPLVPGPEAAPEARRSRPSAEEERSRRRRNDPALRRRFASRRSLLRLGGGSSWPGGTCSRHASGCGAADGGGAGARLAAARLDAGAEDRGGSAVARRHREPLGPAARWERTPRRVWRPRDAAGWREPSARRGDRLGLDRDGIPGGASARPGPKFTAAGRMGRRHERRHALPPEMRAPDRRRDGSAVVLLDHAHLRLERRGRRRGGLRVTTARFTTAAGGRGAGRAPVAVTRSDEAVGTIGTVPRTMGAETTWRTTGGSRT